MLLLGAVYILFVLTGEYTDSYIPSIALLFVSPVLTSLLVAYVMYLFVHMLKARIKINFIIGAFIFGAIQLFLLWAVNYGFDSDTWKEVNQSILIAVLLVGILGYFIRVNRLVNSLVFLTSIMVVTWNFPHGRELLLVAFTDRAVWENKAISIRVSENKTLKMSIPRHYFKDGFAHLIYGNVKDAIEANRQKLVTRWKITSLTEKQ